MSSTVSVEEVIEHVKKLSIEDVQKVYDVCGSCLKNKPTVVKLVGHELEDLVVSSINKEALKSLMKYYMGLANKDGKDIKIDLCSLPETFKMQNDRDQRSTTNIHDYVTAEFKKGHGIIYLPVETSGPGPDIFAFCPEVVFAIGVKGSNTPHSTSSNQSGYVPIKDQDHNNYVLHPLHFYGKKREKTAIQNRINFASTFSKIKMKYYIAINVVIPVYKYTKEGKHKYEPVDAKFHGTPNPVLWTIAISEKIQTGLDEHMRALIKKGKFTLEFSLIRVDITQDNYATCGLFSPTTVEAITKALDNKKPTTEANAIDSCSSVPPKVCTEKVGPTTRQMNKTQAELKDLTKKPEVLAELPTNVEPWMTSLGLSYTDCQELCSVAWISDSVINAGQNLLKEADKLIAGLQPIAAGKVGAIAVQTDRFVQVLHINDNHWITISTIGCNNDMPTVKVFDSMLVDNAPETTAQQIASMLAYNENTEILLEYCRVQQQSGPNDCGLFALAFATSLCFGVCPTVTDYKQDSMRKHLYDCLKNRTMTPFPGKYKDWKTRIVKVDL